jgi:hypothetical protein
MMILSSLFCRYGAELTVMEEGEHWFHTDEQMRFLDNWVMKGRQV